MKNEVFNYHLVWIGFFCLFLSFLLLVIGCQNRQMRVDQEMPTNKQNSSTHRLLRTETYKTSDINNNVRNVSTIEPEYPTIAIPSKIPTISPTALNPKYLKVYLLNLIKSNGNCRLPCFLGISPGITRGEETKEFLKHVGMRYSKSMKKDGVHYSTGLDMRSLSTPISIEFLENAGKIQYITAQIGNLSDNLTTQIDYSPYELSTILSQYGLPSNVMLDIVDPVESPGRQTTYQVWVIYNNLGIIVRYGSSQINVESIYRLCVNSNVKGGIKTVTLFLWDPISYWPDDVRVYMEHARSIEAVSNMTIEDFLQTYKQKSMQKCIETKRENWFH